MRQTFYFLFILSPFKQYIKSIYFSTFFSPFFFSIHFQPHLTKERNLDIDFNLIDTSGVSSLLIR